MNNSGYGIIRQFQDSYLGSRYHGSKDGYTAPDFGRVAHAYGIGYTKVERLEQITADLFGKKGPSLVEVVLSPDALIVTTCPLRIVIAPSVLVGVATAATQFVPSYRSHVAVAFQLPEAADR